MTGKRPASGTPPEGPTDGAGLVPRLVAAARLKHPPSTLDRVVRSGELAAIRDRRSRRVFFRENDLRVYESRLEQGVISAPGKRGSYASSSDGVARAWAPLKEREPRTSQNLPGRETGRWKARYLGTDGRPHQIALFPSKKAAEKATRDRVGELNRAGERVREDGGATIGELVEEWPYGQRVSGRTLSTNRERIRRYVMPHLPAGADTPLSAITEPNVMRVQDELLKRGLGKTTVDGAIAALRALWRDAADGGYVARKANPARGVYVSKTDNRLRPKPRRQHRAVAFDDICAFALRLPERWVARCLLGRFTGVRAGEFPYVNLRNLDRDRQLLWVNETSPEPGHLPVPRAGTKTDRPRVGNDDPGRWVPFPAALGDWILELQPEPFDGYIVRAPRGGYFSLRNFYARVWSPAMDAAVEHAGIVRFDLVDLRHTFASYLHAARVPSADVQRWMGHTDPRSTKSWPAQSDDSLARIAGTTTARVYIHATDTGLDLALAVLTETIEELRDVVGRPRQLRLLPHQASTEPAPAPAAVAVAYARDPASGVRALLRSSLPLQLDGRVPVTVELASELSADDWQRIVDAYSPPSELMRQLRRLAPSNRRAKRNALLEAAAAYYREHGHLDVPRRYVTKGGLALGKFIQNQRQALRNLDRDLTPEQPNELDAISPTWRTASSPAAGPPDACGSTRGPATRRQSTGGADG
jgi:integrase